MFANDADGISFAASSSQLSSSPVLSCPGACGWWPPLVPTAFSSTNATTMAHHQQQQLFAGGAGHDSDGWPTPSGVAPGDDEAMVQLIFAHCKPCPWGTRRLPSSAFSRANSAAGVVPSSLDPSLCHPCEVPLPTIDYLFLLFHAILPFVVNHVAICHHSARRLRHSPRLLPLTLCQLGCALLECSLAFAIALLLFRPFGHLKTFGCPRDGKLGEWYSLLNNPVLQHTRVLHCASELVYPLYSLPFVIYALNLLTLLIVRSLLHFVVAALFGTFLSGAPFYAVLWALPLFALAHAVLSGVLHTLFPFVALSVALLLLVVHLSVAAAADSATTVGKMFRLLVTTENNDDQHNSSSRRRRRGREHRDLPVDRRLPLWPPLLVHVALFAFALFTLCVSFGAPITGQLDELIGKHFGGSWPIFLLILGALLPVPTLFFVLTIRLTSPEAIALANLRLLST